jgi:hypothetical protein
LYINNVQICCFRKTSCSREAFYDLPAGDGELQVKQAGGIAGLKSRGATSNYGTQQAEARKKQSVVLTALSYTRSFLLTVPDPFRTGNRETGSEVCEFVKCGKYKRPL